MEVMREMKLSLADRFAFVDRMIYNWLIGNADAHGKNSFTAAAVREVLPRFPTSCPRRSTETFPA